MTNPIPRTIETERLLIRPPTESDILALSRVYGKKEVYWFPYRRGKTPTEARKTIGEDIRLWEEGQPGRWLMSLKSNGQIIGSIGYRYADWPAKISPGTLDISWRLDPDFWGQGLAKEATKATVLAPKPNTVILATYELDNEVTTYLLAKLGFEYWLECEDPRFQVQVRVDKLLTK